MRKILLTSVLSLSLFAQEDCLSGVSSKQLWIRHTEPEGVGYREGYTTLEAFLQTSSEMYGFYPYLDLRGHVFNNGKYAGNIGVGGRVLHGERIWGANFYYDVRQNKKITFNQLSLGLESIGVIWDFFLNGYLNVGRRNSPMLKYEFDHFANHFLFIKRSIDSALSGFDANIRTHFMKNETWDLYFDIGPYYYHGSFGQNLFGGKAAVSAILGNYFFVEGTASYDHVFKWIGQGIVGFRFPFGGKTIINNCSDQNCILASRMMQIPDHNEMIVVNRHHKVSEAIDPATGNPFFFLFVNNLSSSDGTFESPYPMLTTAESVSSPGNIIYVFEGDGTTRNMDTGITLKDNQQLLGSGVAQEFITQFGPLTVPALTSGRPKITNSDAVKGAVDLANNNTVSGMHIDAALEFGIHGVGIANPTIKNNLITEIPGITNPTAIHLEGPGLSGNIIVDNNVMTGSSVPDMHGMFLIPKSSDIVHVEIKNNYINTPKDCIELKPDGFSTTTSKISFNTFIARDTGGNGFFLENTQFSTHNFIITNNTFTSPSEKGLYTFFHNQSVNQGTVSSNHFINSKIGYQVEGKFDAPLGIVSVSDNTFSGNTQRDFLANIEAQIPPNQATLCLSLSKNTAPALEFAIKRDSATSTLNISTFSDNVGDLIDIGMFPFTQNPTCP